MPLSCVGVTHDGRQMASRRGRADDQGQAPLPLARSRSRWSYPGHPRAEQAQPAGGQTILSQVLKGLRYAPRVPITDKLKSYAAAKVQIMPGVEHRQHKGLNNRALRLDVSALEQVALIRMITHAGQS
jgi:hypothetical protein